MAARRLLVIGGNGFVGTRVVKTALAQGMRVASLSRSGAPADAISPNVEWLTADVVAGGPPVREALAGCDAVISCLGAFGSNAFMHELNGGANAALAEAAAEAGVQRFAFVSASVIQPVAKAMAAAGYEGYYEGKVKAEEAVTRIFGADGVLLRPGPIYGTRVVSPSVSIPLAMIGVPLTTIFETKPLSTVAAALPMSLGDLLMPWVSVEDVAAAAVAHALAESTDGARQEAVRVLEWDAIRQAASELNEGKA